MKMAQLSGSLLDLGSRVGSSRLIGVIDLGPIFQDHSET